VTKNSLAPYLWMLAGCFALAWMTSFAHTLSATLHCDWRLVALARSLLGLVFAFNLARAAGVRLVLWRPRSLWVRSLAGSLSVVCNMYALTSLSAAEVLTLTNTYPIWVALLSWPLLHERPSLPVWLGAFCGVAGVALIQWPYLSDSATLGGNSSEGVVTASVIAVPIALLSAVASAVALLGLHRLRGVGTAAVVVHFSAVASLCTAAICFVGPPPPWEQALEPLIALLLVGVGATSMLGQLCLTRAFATGAPAKVAVVALSQIIFALGLDLLFGQPGFYASTLAGIGLVLAPTAWVVLGRSRDDTPSDEEPGRSPGNGL
jgi:drug/metabolite transporter (DMT)-like permease